jgi:hypothetical protein
VESEEPADPIRRYGPDVRVFEPGSSDQRDSIATVTAPFKLVVDLDPIADRFVRIIRPDNEQLITVVEFLSPTNKTGRGLEKYVQKRADLIEAGVNVVEIDLNRFGDWREVLRPHICPPQALAAYRATIRLGGRREAAYLYPLSLRKPLQPIPIPLRPTDPQVNIDLVALIDETYESGRYGRTIDYTRPADPPLVAEDEAWADQLLRAATRR